MIKHTDGNRACNAGGPPPGPCGQKSPMQCKAPREDCTNVARTSRVVCVPPAGGDNCTFIGADLRVCGLLCALSLTRRKPRGRSGLHFTPGLASTVLTRRLAPAWGIFARTVPGVVPRRCTPGFHRSPLWGSITGDPSISPFGVRSAEGLDL